MTWWGAGSIWSGRGSIWRPPAAGLRHWKDVAGADWDGKTVGRWDLERMGRAALAPLDSEDYDVTRDQRRGDPVAGAGAHGRAGGRCSTARAAVPVSPGDSGRETPHHWKEANSGGGILTGDFCSPPYNFPNFLNFRVTF